MIVLASTAGDVAYYALAIFLVAVGLGTAFMLFKLGQAFGRISSFISGSERDLLPVIVKTGGTVDRINYQLDKADSITDSAVAMADSADTAVRAVSHAVATPVKKVSGLAAGVSHGVSTFRAKRDFGEAMRTAREAAARREADLAEDLHVAGRTPMASERPAPTPPVAPISRPEPVAKPAPTPKPEPAPEPPDEAA